MKHWTRWDKFAGGIAVVLLAIVVWSLVTHMRVIALARQLPAPTNEETLSIVETFRVRGWLAGGQMNRLLVVNADLHGADFSGANLDGIYLFRSDLSGADFSGASVRGGSILSSNLAGANITERQLSTLGRLRGTIMPGETLYDGRYRLAGDRQSAIWNSLDLDDPAALADWYGVPLDDYLAGQTWADANLSGVRSAAVPPTERLRVNWTHVTVGLCASVGLSLLLGGWLALRGPNLFQRSEDS